MFCLCACRFLCHVCVGVVPMVCVSLEKESEFCFFTKVSVFIVAFINAKSKYLIAIVNFCFCILCPFF